MELLSSGGTERKNKREGEERTCGREEEKKEKRGVRVRGREIRVVQKERGKGKKKGKEMKIRGHVSPCEWLGEDEVIFS
jgi:hypothetical protein